MILLMSRTFNGLTLSVAYLTIVAEPGARNKMAPLYFSVCIFLPKGWPLENLRGEKWQAKKQTKTKNKMKEKKITRFNAQRQFKLTNHRHVIGPMSFIRPITNLFALGMANGWSYIFYTCHDFAPLEVAPRGKCPLCHPLPPRYIRHCTLSFEEIGGGMRMWPRNAP